MTRILLTILILLFSSLTFSQTAKTNCYILTIKKGKILKDRKKTYWSIPLTLTNDSKDTLRYFSMSCSWQDFYSVDNKQIQIETALCDKNIPTILILAPWQKRTVAIRLLISNSMETSELKFKIGLNLIKASKTQNPFDFDFKKEQQKKNLIWSNRISM